MSAEPEPQLFPSVLSGWLENPVYKCRNGRTANIIAELQPCDGGPSELRYEGKIEGISPALQFFVWDRDGRDCTADDRQWDIVGREST